MLGIRHTLSFELSVIEVSVTLAHMNLPVSMCWSWILSPYLTLVPWILFWLALFSVLST